MRPIRSTQIEILEPRIAPASLAATFTNGTLKITGIGTTTAVAATLVQLDGDSFDLIDTTTGTPTHFDAVRKVQATLTDLADNLHIVLVSGSGSRVPFSIIIGSGNDQVSVDGGGATWGDFNLSGTGTANVVLGQATLLGDVKVSTANGFFGSTANLGSLSLTGSTTVQLGGTVAGNVKILRAVGGVDVDATGTIHGTLSVTGGTAGAADLALTGITDGMIRLNGSAGAAVLNTSGNFFAGSSISVIGGATTPDIVNIGFASPDPFTSTIHGQVNLALGGGNNQVTVNANGRMSGNFRVSTGDQDDTVSLGGTLIIGGSLQLALGAGTNLTTANQTNVGGVFKYAGGAGADTLNLQNARILASANLSFGDGVGAFSATVSTFSNGVYVKGGLDADTIFLGGATVFGKANFALGDGANQFQATFTSLRGGLVYRGGLGNDTVTLESSNTLSGTASVNGGDGANVFLLQGISFLTAINYTGGTGADAFIYSATTPGFARVKASLGDGADFARIEAATFRSLTVDGGAGADTIERTAGVIAAGFVELNFETKTTF